ncbi:MAG: recombinase family protein [Clostridia bacterium]|nr:recombinase family protein [Clostridia bacterium]MBR7132036.1 recombinase family protein [Clostridia bacterium]
MSEVRFSLHACFCCLCSGFFVLHFSLWRVCVLVLASIGFRARKSPNGQKAVLQNRMNGDEKKKRKELKLTNTKYYVDDGYTGTNFNRPGFQAMLEDIEMGYVTTVMVKDLSRLGRDYVSVGHYTDNFFPEHNIRFIAVKDLVDSKQDKA